ncbi:hypothetical protein ACFR97_10360 [Haloplanus litoreus]|uniref:Uncharacterized protein n=1 Tax=Haloplanus litoreus TaxID=767515 RepID=A0ABD6A2K9_9EURY
MPETTDTDERTDTLTLRASGTAVIERERSEGDLDVTITEEADLDATLDVDARWIKSHGGVYKQGAHLKRSDVTELIAERLSGDDAQYYVEDTEVWTLRLDGRVDDWLNVAIYLAKDRRRGSNAKIATNACHILDGLAEYTPEDALRPYLAILDLLGQYDISDYTRVGVLDDLIGEETGAVAEEVPANA